MAEAPAGLAVRDSKDQRGRCCSSSRRHGRVRTGPAAPPARLTCR
ncbi:hypothetical protein O7606_01635 [Micromonospora sp. WMMD882]|nr:hypothetical protein [Micromonospora sp. WMMD882]WBB82252.1 hypothetical protein O7606_01635 [Micromonospora sp. WMMD882]